MGIREGQDIPFAKLRRQVEAPMMLSSLYFILLLNACLVSHAQFINSSSIHWKNIFILAGQSNMSGRGGVVNDTWDGIIPLKCRPRTKILRLNAQLTWEEASDPLHRDIDVYKTCGVGPGTAFANAVLDNDSSFGVVGLVPCAVGGTNMSEWARGTHLYNELVRRTEAALLDGGTIRGVLWYQGESDTVSREDADSYQGKLEKFILDLRSDLSYMLPVFQGKLFRVVDNNTKQHDKQIKVLGPRQVALASGQGPYIETVREAQLGLGLLNVISVDAKGLPREPDGLHLSTRAQVRLGEMLAHAFLQTIQPNPIISNAAPSRFSNSISDLLIRPLFRYLRMILRF